MIVLDTHIFLWSFLQPEKIPTAMLDAIDAESSYGLAAISLWETAMLFERNRIELPEPPQPWLERALRRPALRLIPLTPSIAARSVGLPMHGDPADRLIVATALEYDCPLATVDGRLIRLPMLRTIQGDHNEKL